MLVGHIAVIDTRYRMYKFVHGNVPEGTLLAHKAFAFSGPYLPPCFFSTLAQVSFSATVRLKTGAPGLESGSAQK